MYLQVSHLSKSFAGLEVLKDVSFTLNSQDRIALLGKNGSGKSTLFKIIQGQISPDSGTVLLQPKQLKVGYLPQVISDSPGSSGQKLINHLKTVLSTNPSILLLDEPTNHLDESGLNWLKHIVQDFSGPVMLISHDRDFLDQVVEKIYELEDGGLKIYGGNYASYKQQKQILQSAQIRDYEQQQSRIKKLENRASTIKNRTQQLEVATTGRDHYARRKASKSARSAISMEKRITKELGEVQISKPEQDWNLKALFLPKIEGSQTVLRITDLSYKNILTNIQMTIQKGQRIALTGENGSGKTTLVKIILKELNPDQGEIALGNNIQIGYLSQDHQELSGDGSVLDELQSNTVDRTAAYQLLRRFLLPPEKINQATSALSSGEKSKVLLAKIMTSGANFLILDEPTNHLDIPSREAIELALANYSGTLLVISHDRYFLKALGITHYYLLKNTNLSTVNL